MIIPIAITIPLLMIGIAFIYHIYEEKVEIPKRWYRLWVDEAQRELNRPMASYSKIVKIDLDFLIKIGALNRNRIRYQKPHFHFDYEHILYNANQEDEVSVITKNYYKYRDTDGTIRYIEADFLPPFYWLTNNYEIETITEEKVQKAENVWTRNNTILFTLSYEDYRKFLKMVDEEKERQKVEKEAKDLQLVIESAQADIERLKKQAEAEIKQANAMMEEVTKNITLST